MQPLALLVLVRAVDAPGPDRVPDSGSARIFLDRESHHLVIELAPVDLPANTPHHMLAQPPVATLEIPATGSAYGFRIDVVDSSGDALPRQLLHHFNLIDPDHRELFLPISRRLLAAGQETAPIRLPWLLFGLPVKAGEHVVASAMLENLTAVTYHRARVRLVMFFTPSGRPWPVFRVSPWQMDVAFPAGDKSFDLLPGRSSRSYEASPALPGTIVGLGGHFHELGQRIEFVDATTGEVIYRAAPVRDSTGHLVSVPMSRLYGWTHLGLHIVPGHTYRVTVYYDNPTGRTLPDAGMGVVGGLFIPDGGAAWPPAERGDSLYQVDFRHYMRLAGGHVMQMAGREGSHVPSHAPGHH